MNQEFTMAVVDFYESKFTASGVKIETEVLVEFGSTTFGQCWQIGTFIIPMVVSQFVDL